MILSQYILLLFRRFGNCPCHNKALATCLVTCCESSIMQLGILTKSPNDIFGPVPTIHARFLHFFFLPLLQASPRRIPIFNATSKILCTTRQPLISPTLSLLRSLVFSEGHYSRNAGRYSWTKLTYLRELRCSACMSKKSRLRDC